MYCGKCGARIEGTGNFCSRCGQALGGAAQRPYAYSVCGKSAGAAALLSFLWAGLGQIYVGRVARGIGIMLSYLLIAFLCTALMFAILSADYVEGVVPALILMTAAGLALMIWNVFDAYKLAKKYNDALRTSGRKPW